MKPASCILPFLVGVTICSGALVPENLALGKKGTASSVQGGNDIANAFDGDLGSRWCASSGKAPQWLQVDLGKPEEITGIRIVWENDDVDYRGKIEVSADGQSWKALNDGEKWIKGPLEISARERNVRHVRLSYLGASAGKWGSVRELMVLGTKMVEAPKAPPPNEAKWLGDVKVADGFEATLFSAPPMANYPVFVAAAPDGTLYVSSDGNGSLGRDKDRGRILRLRDTDGDGRADEVKEFVPNVDSPRGLVWDGDRLYVMHPPHLSAFIDKDGDGVSDEQKVLVKNLAFTFKDRPADHTTNGIELGIDGWIYIAVGDFGFMEAEGADGRKMQLRGGGIVRVRPDGTQMELYSRGTRNILEAAVSPLLDLFTRDNTNDGGGWDLRFHHLSGFEDHGYPRLYMNFGDEVIKPLADYGGGSGCGAAWIDEPGWPAAWNNRPYTSDWGRGPIYRHTVKVKGASFEETEKPAEFVKVTRSTDIDIDAQGFAYVASWKGATFNWNGPDVGYIVRVAPKGHTPAKVPDFAKLADADLVKLLESPSHRTRREAQRTLLRRGAVSKVANAIGSIVIDTKKPLPVRVAALYTLQQGVGTGAVGLFTRLAGDATIAPWVLRALGETKGTTAEPMLTALKSPDARTRNEAMIALARWHGLTGVASDGAWAAPQLRETSSIANHTTALIPLLGNSDDRIAHTAVQILRQFGAAAAEPLFAALDQPGVSTPLRDGLLRTLRGIHDAKIVDGLIARLARTTDSTARQGLLTALCRLYFTEGKWKGDSWGTRPDTRGPYYQPEEWSESAKIAQVLKATLDKAQPDEASFLAKEFARHRIKLNDAATRLVALAANDASLVPVLSAQLAQAETIPSEALPVLLKAVNDPAMKEDTVAASALALVKTDNADACRALLAALARLSEAKDKKDLGKVRNAFFGSRLIENHHQLIEAEAAKLNGASSKWADAALLQLSARKIGSPEPREMAAKALDAGWSNAKRRAQIIEAAALAEEKSRALAIVTALKDSDPAVAKAAEEIVKKLKLDPAKIMAESKSASLPLIATLKPEQAIAQALEMKGDITRGEQVFAQAGCVACHTVKENEPVNGPFLGNIATTYKRRELAEAILLPNKTIAQGFVTNVFTKKDGSILMGFVIQEAADRVVIRDIAAQEIILPTADITKREKSDRSLMPEGLMASMTVKDLASLLDYLEALVKK